MRGGRLRRNEAWFIYAAFERGTGANGQEARGDRSPSDSRAG